MYELNKQLKKINFNFSIVYFKKKNDINNKKYFIPNKRKLKIFFIIYLHCLSRYVNRILFFLFIL